MSKRVDRMEWFERRVARWMEHADRLGLSQDDVAALKRRLERAREGLERRRAAWVAAQAASREFDELAGDAGRAGMRLLRRIRAAAVSDPEVWALAGVKQGSADQPPHAPCDIRAQVREEGVELRWNGSMVTPQGMSYVVERRLADRAGYRFVAITKQPKFRDVDVPPGMPFVCYRILARRGALISDYSEPVTVRFSQTDEGKQAA